MTLVSCAREPSVDTGVINASYRKSLDRLRSSNLVRTDTVISSSEKSDLLIRHSPLPDAFAYLPTMYVSTMYDYQTASSSSSSGITTPVDNSPPSLVAFPKSRHGLTSSGSSSLSSHKHRARHLSISSVASASLPRPFKLSLESSKASPVPAVSSASEDHSPLGAFSLTSSAEGHLRSIVTRVVSVTPRVLLSKATGSEPHSTNSASPERARKATRTLPQPWAVDTDSEDEGAYWPLQSAAERRNVPAITRSPSPPKAHSSDVANPRARFAATRSVSSPKPQTRNLRKPAPVRANTYDAPPQPRAVASLRLPEAPHPPRTFLRPAAPKNKGKAIARPISALGAEKPVRSIDESGLDPALAAVENASRFRAKCVCGVCGKMGVDYPRCPRCTLTWCSRDCRVSNAAAGAARHICEGKQNASGKGHAHARPISIGV